MQVDETERLKAEVARLRGRLQFDPGGSDRIDELEQSLQFSRHNSDTLVAEVDRLKAHTWEQERAAVVAWLRAPSVGQSAFNAIDLCTAANRIEAGEHWPERENG